MRTWNYTEKLLAEAHVRRGPVKQPETPPETFPRRGLVRPTQTLLAARERLCYPRASAGAPPSEG